MNVFQVDPLPHQIEAVYHYMLRNPLLRFLLADDPGAGKTITAGLLLKELKYRTYPPRRQHGRHSRFAESLWNVNWFLQSWGIIEYG